MPSFTNVLDGVEKETYAVLSTAHITENDSKLLKQLCDDLSEGFRLAPPTGILYLTPLDYGWRIKHQSDAMDDGMIGRSMRELSELGFSEAFCDLIKSAIMSTYHGFVLDRDAEVYDHIEQFSW